MLLDIDAQKAVKIYREDTCTLIFTVINSLTNAVLDLTPYGAVFAVKQNIHDPDEQAILTRRVIGLGADGLVTITLSANDTDIEVGRYYYALKLTGAGLAATVAQSTLTILPFWDGRS